MRCPEKVITTGSSQQGWQVTGHRLPGSRGERLQGRPANREQEARHLYPLVVCLLQPPLLITQGPSPPRACPGPLHLHTAAQVSNKKSIT